MSAVLGHDVPDVLSVEKAAEVLGISRSAAYEAVARHELPAVRVGARILIPRFRLEHFLRTGRDVPEPRVRRRK